MDPSQDSMDSMESLEWNLLQGSQDSIQKHSIQKDLHDASFHSEDRKQFNDDEMLLALNWA